MRPISEGIYGLLVSQGIANGRAGTRANGRKIARTAGTGAAWNKVASSPVAGDHSPTAAGEDREPMGIREKDGAAKPRQFNREEVSNHAQEPSPARGSRPVLRLVVSNKCEPTRPQSERLPPLGVGSHLVLVWSEGHATLANSR